MRPLLLALFVVALPAAALAQHQLGVSTLGGMFSRFPGSGADNGGALSGSYSLWLGESHRFLQLRADVNALAGMGSSGSFYGSIGLSAGADVYLFDWLSIDFRGGPASGAQLGNRSTPLLGLWGSGGWSLHPFAERARRITLAMNMSMLLPTRSDAGNDCVCGGFLGIGLGYVTPLP